jgi:hypothetical protein
VGLVAAGLEQERSAAAADELAAEHVVAELPDDVLAHGGVALPHQADRVLEGGGAAGLLGLCRQYSSCERRPPGAKSSSGKPDPWTS